MRRILTVLVAVALAAVVAGAGYWAGTTAIVPPELPVASHAAQAYVAATGTVGRSTRVAVTAAWAVERTILGGADGVVTAVRHPPGALAREGDVIATVELQPVVVAEGRVPMFRTLKQDITGPDVRQFQQLLHTGGFLEKTATGRFDAGTVAATKRWQRSIGAAENGVVDPGMLVFVDALPARLTVIPAVGSLTSPRAEFLRVLSTSPTFSASVSAATRTEFESGMAVTITAPDGASWAGALGSFEATPDGRFQATITGPLCGDACDSVPVIGETALRGTVILVPEQEGVVVPVSALTQLPSGAAAVFLTDGTSHVVTVTAEADGFAIVDGVEAGTSILLPAAPAP